MCVCVRVYLHPGELGRAGDDCVVLAHSGPTSQIERGLYTSSYIVYALGLVNSPVLCMYYTVYAYHSLPLVQCHVLLCNDLSHGHGLTGIMCAWYPETKAGIPFDTPSSCGAHYHD